MAYAKLTFSSTATVQQKLKDIAKVCTGAATTVAGLEFAIQSQSEVVSAEPAGWTMADAASALEVSGTATINEYRLQSPCVNTSKIKYCALTVYSLYTTITASLATTTNTRPAAGATTGYLWAPIGTGVTANTLDNAGFVARQFKNNDSSNRSFVAANTISIGSALEIYVSVTNRKLILFTFVAGAVSQIILNLEFPETINTTSGSNLPAINITCNSFTAANSATALMLNGDTIANTSSNATLNKTAYLPNWFSSLTRTRSNISADGALQLHYLPTVPSASISSSGIPVFPLMPIIDVRTTVGEGVHDYSALTGTYQSYRTSTYNMHGDEFSYSGTTYVFLTVGANRIIAVKKA